jgi:hypothetical protein
VVNNQAQLEEIALVLWNMLPGMNMIEEEREEKDVQA